MTAKMTGRSEAVFQDGGAFRLPGISLPVCPVIRKAPDGPLPRMGWRVPKGSGHFPQDILPNVCPPGGPRNPLWQMNPSRINRPVRPVFAAVGEICRPAPLSDGNFRSRVPLRLGSPVR